MKLEQLNYLLVLAEEQNISKAAKRLFITQPTLTGYINRLESQLGVRLFDRSRSPVRLTRSGQIYLAKMKELVSAEEKLKEELRYADSDSRKFSVGIGYAHSALLCPRLARELVQVWPSLDICLWEQQEAQLMQLLKAGNIDLFLGHAVIDTDHFHFGVLRTETMCFAVRRDLLAARGFQPTDNTLHSPCMVDARFLSLLRIILPGQAQGSYLNVKSILTSCHVLPQHTISTANMFTAARMAALGLGYCFTNDEIVAMLPPELRQDLVYIAVPGMIRERKFYYGYSEKNENLEVIRSAITILQGLVGASEGHSGEGGQ